MGSDAQPSGGATVPIPEPVGRSLLTWQGKAHPSPVVAPTMRVVEQHALDPAPTPDAAGTDNMLFHGDNLAVLAHLLESGLRGRVQLVYIDPPFDSNADYVRKVRRRDRRAPQVGRTVEYRDVWQGDSYLQFMYARLLLLRELLAEDGSIWLHCDYRQVHRLHLLLEEVFGSENYLNTIAWRSQVTRGAKVNAFYFPFSTQYIEIFGKNRAAPTRWHPQRKQLIFTRRQAAAQFMEDEQGFFRTSDPGTYSYEKLVALHGQGRLYAPYDGEIVIDEAAQRVYCSNGGNIGVKYYLDQVARNRFAVERGVDNLWDDIPGLGTTPGEDVGYPTQKTKALLRRVISASTDPGDLVLDCFLGSGTTVAVAEEMGRRWIGCDRNYGSIQTTRRRLQRLQAAGEGGTFAVAACADDGPAAHRDAVQATVEIGRLSGEPSTIAVAVLAVAATDDADSVAADWRTGVDAIEIDPAYDGAVFRPALVDAPPGRREQVRGTYQLTGLPDESRVAVRITDIWGAEMLLVQVC